MQYRIIFNDNVLARFTATAAVFIFTGFDTDSIISRIEYTINNQRVLARFQVDGITILGGKTGTTRAAGSCLILGSQDESGNDYISVVLKAESRDVLYDNMTKIIGKIVN